MDRPVVRGYDPSRGDFAAGAFSQYGMRTLFFGVDHKESRSYIGEYRLDGDDDLGAVIRQLQLMEGGRCIRRGHGGRQV
jgi:hypothetical protein